MDYTPIVLAYLISGVALFVLALLIIRVHNQRSEFRHRFTYALILSAVLLSCVVMFLTVATRGIWPEFFAYGPPGVFAFLTVSGALWLAVISHRLNILPHKEDLAAKEEARHTLAAVIDATPVAILKLDMDSRLTLWNKAAERMFGWTESEVLGKELPIITQQDRDSFKRRLKSQMSGEWAVGTEIERVRKDGTHLTTCLWTAPVVDANGRISSVVGAIADTTERKKIEEELQKAKALAESANSAKSIFLANFSHELRTPLTAILGYIELLSNRSLALEKRDRYISYIRSNGLLLGSLVEDILDLACIEAKKVRVETSKFSVYSLVSDLEAALELRARAKGLEFTITLNSTNPQMICTDSTRLRQIILNIAGNAIKFTDHGYVRIVIDYENVQDFLLVRVTDSGPGIPSHKWEKIFEPFVQIGTTPQSGSPGAGLGLPLARQLARALGGDLSLIESQEGRGSTFEARVIANARKAEGGLKEESKIQPTVSISSPWAKLIATETLPLSGMRILIVEDNHDLRILFAETLAFAGAQVGEAIDGLDAVEKAAGKHWDVILMDVQMPKMDGYEATRILRNHGFDRPIIALSANAMPQHQGTPDPLALPVT